MTVEQRYESAKEQYRAIGVDTDAAIEKLKNVAISMHCWQGDDVTDRCLAAFRQPANIRARRGHRRN